VNQTAPDVAVLLCSFNGSRYLAEQLDSIRRQTHEAWRLYASDDGSTDGTPDVFEQWGRRTPGRLMPLRAGPGQGHAANFLQLVTAQDVRGDFFAFSDQDDIWDEDKLARALDTLSAVPAGRPALYCARTRSISASGAAVGESPLFRRAPGFANALLQNIAGGNTMVMNAAARELLCTAGVVDVVSHDWWVYLLVSGAGGEVFYDSRPCLSYRQHGDNAIGDNRGLRSRWNRYRSFLQGRNADWYERNIAALLANENLLAESSRSTLSRFCQARTGHLPGRLAALVRSGVYAQTLSGQLGLLTATLLKKI